MDRVAIFVDAGYLFAAGSAALEGKNQPRRLVTIDQEAVVAELLVCATEMTGLPLLRIYWYDGVTPKGPNPEHLKIAACRDIKLRLGFINSSGQQKGVDSLIVTDLIELARNRAISDAILCAGDEDLRIGVQIAQSYGVRLHLLGIAPSRGNQARQLAHEADTTSEWAAEIVTKFLRVDSGISIAIPDAGAIKPPQSPPVSISEIVGIVPPQSDSLQECAKQFHATLRQDEVAAILSHWEEYSQLPGQFDGRLLGSTRDKFGRILDQNERRTLRTYLISFITPDTTS